MGASMDRNTAGPEGTRAHPGGTWIADRPAPGAPLIAGNRSRTVFFVALSARTWDQDAAGDDSDFWASRLARLWHRLHTGGDGGSRGPFSQRGTRAIAGGLVCDRGNACLALGRGRARRGWDWCARPWVLSLGRGSAVYCPGKDSGSGGQVWLARAGRPGGTLSFCYPYAPRRRAHSAMRQCSPLPLQTVAPQINGVAADSLRHSISIRKARRYSRPGSQCPSNCLRAVRG